MSSQTCHFKHKIFIVVFREFCSGVHLRWEVALGLLLSSNWSQRCKWILKGAGISFEQCKCKIDLIPCWRACIWTGTSNIVSFSIIESLSPENESIRFFLSMSALVRRRYKYQYWTSLSPKSLASKMKLFQANPHPCAAKFICLLFLASLPYFTAAARKKDIYVRPPHPPAIPEGTPSGACDPQAFSGSRCFVRRMVTTGISNKYELQAFRPTYPGHSPGVGHDAPPTGYASSSSSAAGGWISPHPSFCWGVVSSLNFVCT